MDRLRYAQHPGVSGYTVGVPTTEYRYYDNGRLSYVSHGNRTWEYAYNDIDLLQRESLTIDNEVFQIRYGYDNYAKRNSVTYPGSSGQFGRQVQYEINGFGQETKINGFVDSASYFPSGMVQSTSYANGTTFSSTQDDYQRPIDWITRDANVDDIFDFKYFYDARSNVTGIEGYFSAFGGQAVRRWEQQNVYL